MSLVSGADADPGAAHKEDCVSCIMYGFKWCGRYSSMFQKTKCDYTIDYSLCKVPIAADDVTKCYDETLNPVYEGRPEPAWVAAKEAEEKGEPVDTGVWDSQCT